jgi:FMN-dependent oxidoreductase (nitrilotriacetate monooxygenase family)
MTKRMMKMGVSMHVLGYHAASWRLPDVPADGLMQFDHFVNVMQIAERGLLDMAFLADHGASRNLMVPELLRELHHNNVKHEPLMLLAALATITSHIGLVSTVCSTYNEPYTIARMLASIDHISNGRAGWNFVTGFCSDEARNYGYDALPPQPFRKARGAEFLEAVHRLFDSWEDDAMVRDKQSGIFFDRKKVHAIDFKGEYLNVRGPLDICRPVQGLLPLVMAGDSESTRELAAQLADVLYAIKADYALAREYYGSVKERMSKYNRHPDELKIMPGMMIFVGKTEFEARAKFDRITEATDVRVGLSQMLPIWGDLSEWDLDGPAPELTVGTALQPKGVRHNSGGASGGPGLDFAVAKINREVKTRKLTLRQLAKLMPGAGLWEKTIVGTPAQVADEMEYWFMNGAADGFNLQPPYMPGALSDFVDLVVPELQRRGHYRTAYEGTTLRENLGLRRPASRYVAA